MIIDADAHVEESEAIFDRIDKEFRPRRPLAVRLDTDTVYGKHNAVWLIDGDTYPKLVGKGGTIFRTPTIMEAASLKRESLGAQELTDVAARIRDMDKVKIDTSGGFSKPLLDGNLRRLAFGSARYCAPTTVFSANARRLRRGGFASPRWFRSAMSRNRSKRSSARRSSAPRR